MLFPNKQTSKPKNFLRKQTHKKPKKFQLINKIINLKGTIFSNPTKSSNPKTPKYQINPKIQHNQPKKKKISTEKNTSQVSWNPANPPQARSKPIPTKTQPTITDQTNQLTKERYKHKQANDLAQSLMEAQIPFKIHIVKHHSMPPMVFSKSFSSNAIDDDRIVVEVFLINHGECELNLRLDFVFEWCLEAALTIAGKRQARETAKPTFSRNHLQSPPPSPKTHLQSPLPSPKTHLQSPLPSPWAWRLL